nr:hypothetical protein [Betaproteobacteria bacterium]
MAFNLARFRELAFGQARASDTPPYDVADAQKLVALLPQDDPVRALADLTCWVQGMNSLASLPPERRARVLLALDQAARPLWQALGARYLAPRGRPGEGREGDSGILRALFDSASELAHGLAIVLEADARWSGEGFARLVARSLRWLGRRLSLAHMLALPVTGATWEGLHRAYTLAEANGAALTPMPAYEGAPHQTTARREYLRALLLELADPAGMRPREVELAYRVVARVASAARLEPAA